MGEEKDKKEEEKTGTISRREFLKDAGLVVGGATLGSMAIVSACSGGSGATSTVTQTATKTVTVTTTAGAGATTTATVTVTAPPVTQPGAAAPAGVITLNVNGTSHVVKVEPEWTLSFVLRKKLGLTGTKQACDRGECGLCTILVDGTPVLSCCIPAIEAEGMNITTIEGLAKGPTLHPVQQAFLDAGTYQCGYCTPAMILCTAALWAKSPNPTPLEAREAISGNLCWCGDQTRIIRTILKNPIQAGRGV